MATDILTLPGGLRDGQCRLDTAELAPLNGRQEEWLAQHRDAPAAVATTELLAACLVRLGDLPASRDLVRRLLVGDREFLMLQLRRMTLGDDIHAVVSCGACGARMDVTLRASQIPIVPRPQDRDTYRVERPHANGDADSIVFRLPRGADHEAIAGLDAPAAIDALLDRCVLEPGSDALAADDRRRVSDAMDDVAPQVDVELDLVCPECGRAFVEPIDVVAFFLDELRIGADQLLREIHALAYYYHWSEADILALDRPRRRAYLRLLNETLGEE